MATIIRLDEIPALSDNLPIKLTKMGNTMKTQTMTRCNTMQTVQRLPNNEYIVLSTGEIKQSNKFVTRQDNKNGLYKTFNRLIALVNANVTDDVTTKVRWCTLTYRANMTDTKQLDKDFKNFIKRFNRYCIKENWGKPEYIAVPEPQRRGAWHIHVIFIWENKAPYIANATFSKLWGNGFVNIRAAVSDNMGAYLSAYLGDLELNDNERCPKNCTIKEIETENGQKKRIIKGGRMHLYPAKFNIIRHSQGIKQPESVLISKPEAERILRNYTKTYENAVKVIDTSKDYENTIIKAYYRKNNL